MTGMRFYHEPCGQCVSRIVHCLSMLLRVQAPDEQYLATVQHASLQRAYLHLLCLISVVVFDWYAR